MNSELKSNVMMADKWIRLFFMVVFAAVNYLAQMLILVLSLAQFLFTLFASKPNEDLLHFTQGLTTYSYQIMKYLTYNSDERPYPFTAWPK